VQGDLGNVLAPSRTPAAALIWGAAAGHPAELSFLGACCFSLVLGNFRLGVVMALRREFRAAGTMPGTRVRGARRLQRRGFPCWASLLILPVLGRTADWLPSSGYRGSALASVVRRAGFVLGRGMRYFHPPRGLARLRA